MKSFVGKSKSYGPTVGRMDGESERPTDEKGSNRSNGISSSSALIISSGEGQDSRIVFCRQ